ERGQGAGSLALGRRGLDPPRELRQWTALRPASDVVGVEEGAGLVPERARLAGRAVVGCRFAHEVEPARRPRARRLEEVALARDRFRSGQPRAARRLLDRAALLVREERRALLAAREAALLEAEDEHDLGSARSRAQEVGDSDAARLVAAGEPERGPVEDAVELFAGERAAEVDPRLQLVEQVVHGPMSAQVEDRVRADGRRLEPVCGANHRADERPNGYERLGLRAERIEHPQRLPAQLERLFDDPPRLADSPSAQPTLQVVDVGAGQPGERGTQEAVQVVPPAVEPLEAQQREQRLAERRLADPDPALDRVRHAERREGGLELGALPLDARADEEDLLGLRAASDQLEHLVGDELERSARARTFEEADRSLELRCDRRPVGEEVALEVSELGRRDVAVSRRQLLDAPRRERAQILGRARQRFERRPVRLVRKRDRDLGAAGKRLEQRPLCAGQVLEAVREDRPIAPGLELAGDEVSRVAPLQVAVPEAELLELSAIRGVE